MACMIGFIISFNVGMLVLFEVHPEWNVYETGNMTVLDRQNSISASRAGPSKFNFDSNLFFFSPVEPSKFNFEYLFEFYRGVATSQV